MEYNTYEEAVASLTNEQLGNEICSKQQIQRTNPPTSVHWQRASKLLAVFFTEAQKREKEGRADGIRSL